MKVSKKNNGFSKSIYDTLLQAYRPFFIKICIVSVLGFLGRLLLLSNAQMIAHFVDSYPVLTIELLKGLATNLFVVLTAAFVMTLFYRTIFSRLSAQAVSRIYDETTYRVSRFPLSFFDQNPVGKITTRFSSDYGNVFRLFGGPLAEFLSILFDLVSIGILMVLINPLFLLSLSLGGLCFSFILKRNQIRLRENRRELSILRGPSVAHFSETVQGSLSIRQKQKQNTFQNRFQNLDRLHINSKMSVVINIMRFSTELNLMSTALFILNGLMCYYLMQNNLIGAGQTTLILGFTVLATNTLQMFFEWYSQFEEALVGVERLDEYLRAPLEEGAILPAQSDFETSHPKRRKDTKAIEIIEPHEAEHLIVENLTFRYPGQDHDTLQLISFRLNAGQKLGIIGRTGAGKSTLISALLRLYPSRSGAILINHQVQPDVEEHRKLFSVISQDQFFIKGTLRDNLDLFKSFSNESLIHVLKQVGIGLSLHALVEEKGQNLSQGEKQLISLARGLLQSADIFIFDEATSNVDPQSEVLIETALRQTLSQKTQIRIAHRLQTVQDCDLILWLENGRVKKIGPPQEILVAFEASR